MTGLYVWRGFYCASTRKQMSTSEFPRRLPDESHRLNVTQMNNGRLKIGQSIT